MSEFGWLLPSVGVERWRDHVKLSDFEDELRIAGRIDEVIECLSALDGSRRLSELRRDFRVSKALFGSLERRGWLVRLQRSLAAIVGDRHERARQLSFFAHLQPDRPERAFSELGRRTAVIVGVGGVGTHTALNLAGSGIGRLILVDPDTVERSNLNRQILFTLADVGRPKVEVVATALRRRFEQLAVETLTVNLDADASARLPRGNAIIACGECKSLWDRPALVGRTPFLTAGYFGRVASIGPCIAPTLGGTCWPCVMRHYDREETARAEARTIPLRNAWNPSGATINALAGSLLSEAAVRLLAPSLGDPLLLNGKLEIDTKTLSVSRIKFDARPRRGCPCFCGRSASARQAVRAT